MILNWAGREDLVQRAEWFRVCLEGDVLSWRKCHAVDTTKEVNGLERSEGNPSGEKGWKGAKGKIVKNLGGRKNLNR